MAAPFVLCPASPHFLLRLRSGTAPAAKHCPGHGARYSWSNEWQRGAAGQPSPRLNGARTNHGEQDTMSQCGINKLATPCASCPWRTNTTARDIPNFSMPLAESLASTCPDARDHGPDFFATYFACHQSKPGSEFACAGWLAKVGHRHPRVRLAVSRDQLDAAALSPGDGWPDLHDNYQQVLEKLRATCASDAME